MGTQRKTKAELLEEIADLRRQLAAVEEREESLRESERLHRDFLHEFKGIAFRGKLGYQPTLLAGDIESITGYTAEEFLRGSVRVDQIIHPDDFARLQESMERLRTAPGYATEREYRIVRKGGDVRWLHEVIHNLCDGTGKPVAVQGILHDVTRRKQMEEALYEREQRATLLLQVAPLGIHECDAEGRIVFVNSTQARITGYTLEELVGTNIWDRIAPGPEKDSMPGYLRHLASEQPPPTPYYAKNVRKNGEVFDIRVDWDYKRNSQGQVTGFVSIVTDITEQRRAEEALRESERRLSTLLSNLPGMAYRCRNDADWTMEFVSEGCLALTGYQRSELLGNRVKSYGDIIHPDDRQTVVECVQHGVAERRRFQLEYRIRTAQGEEKWVWEQGVAVLSSSGEVEALEGFIADITKRKQAEDALRDSEERYRTLAESTTDIIYILDPRGRLLYTNRSAAQRFGRTPADLVGKGQEDLFSPEIAKRHLERIRSVFETGEGAEMEALYRFGNQDVWLNVRSIPLRDAQGQVRSVMGVCRDVTERKRAEEALQRAHDDLERRVRERTAELAKANEELDVFHRFAEASSQGFGMADLDGRITYSNPAMCRLLGEDSPEDTLGKQSSDYYPDDYRERREREIVPAVLRHGYWQGELMIGSSRGKLTPAIHYFFLIRDERGAPFRLAAAVVDLSERKRAEEALERERRTLKHLLQSSDHERQLIAYEIHDGLAQQLAGAIMQLDAFNHLKDRDPLPAADAFHAGMTMLRQGHAEARRLISGVRPPILDEAGVVAAVAHLVNEERHLDCPQVEFRSDVQFQRLAPTLENSLYRIVQEGLANACRHSKSAKVRVALVQHGDQIRVEIQDQGIGFHLEEIEDSHFGVAGIRQRARLLGGSAVIDSAPGAGTRITVDLPLIPKK